MNELFSKLGIDWKLLTAQIVNFLVLLWILKRFAYRPILNALRQRSERIAKSLDGARKLETETAVMQKEKENIISHSRRQAQEIVEQARQNADQYLNDARRQTRMEVERALENAKSEAEHVKGQAITEAKSEIADLVVMATEKMIGQKIDPKTDAKLIERAVSEAYRQGSL